MIENLSPEQQVHLFRAIAGTIVYLIIPVLTITLLYFWMKEKKANNNDDDE